MTLSEFVDSQADAINRSVIAELEREELYSSSDLEQEVQELYVPTDFSF